MTGLVEVFAGVPVRARVATSDVATGQTHAQMSPGVPAVLFAVLAVPRCAWSGLVGILRGLEVFARYGDRRCARIARA